MSDRIATRRLYLDAAKETVVLEDDPRAAFLLCGVGAIIPAGFEDPTTTPEPEPELVVDVKLEDQQDVNDDQADDEAEKVEDVATPKKPGRSTTKKG